jgi:excisionase family DNA binding protein
MEPLAVTIAEAAKRLSVSTTTIRAMIADKRLPCTRIVGRSGTRGRIVIRVTDLEALLTSDEVAA